MTIATKVLPWAVERKIAEIVALLLAAGFLAAVVFGIAQWRERRRIEACLLIGLSILSLLAMISIMDIAHL